jgi:chromosome segregation ATPase
MTTINTFEDILEAMERNPALRDAMRRHLLTEELLQLPSRVSRLEELVAELASKLAELTETFARFVEQTNLALAQLNADVTELKISVARLTEGQDRLTERQDRLTEGQDRLIERQDRLTVEQNRLAEGQDRLIERQDRLTAEQNRLAEGQDRLIERQDRLTVEQNRLAEGQDRLIERQDRLTVEQNRLAEGQDRLIERQDRLTEGQNRISGQLNNLMGSDYERRAARVVLRRLKRHFNIDPSEILRSSAVPGNPDVSNLLSRVVDAGIVSEDEAEDLELADIIVRGQDPGGATVHVVAEVSITIHEEDIKRASRRAGVLESATGGTTHAVVVGESASPDSLEIAAQEKVAFFQIMGR